MRHTVKVKIAGASAGFNGKEYPSFVEINGRDFMAWECNGDIHYVPTVTPVVEPDSVREADAKAEERLLENFILSGYSVRGLAEVDKNGEPAVSPDSP